MDIDENALRALTLESTTDSQRKARVAVLTKAGITMERVAEGLSEVLDATYVKHKYVHGQKKTKAGWKQTKPHPDYNTRLSAVKFAAELLEMTPDKRVAHDMVEGGSLENIFKSVLGEVQNTSKGPPSERNK